ncbi:MAG: O-antigen ligase family protein [Chloroflexota bacterium]
MLTELTRLFTGKLRGESIILVLCAPFLLFPTVLPLLTLLALLLLAFGWLRPFFWRTLPQLPPSPLNLLFLLFGLTWLIAIPVTADPDLTLPKATGLLLGFAVWRYLLLVVDSEARLWQATAVFLLLGLGFMALGVLSTNWLFKIPGIATLLQRVAGRFLLLPETPELGTHANELAATLLLFWPLLLALTVGLRGRWRRTTAVFLLLTTLILLLTQSRSGWVGAAGGVGLLLVGWGWLLPPSRLRRWLLGGFATFAGLVVLAIILIGPATLQNWWLNPPLETAVGSFNSLNFRQTIWPWAIQAIYDFPFTGTGLGSFRRVGPRLYPIAVPPNYDIAHAHNILLQVALDLGLPGLVVYLAILLLLVTVGWQVAQRDGGKRPLILGLLASLAALHIYGLADALALGAKPGLLFWVNIALLTAAARLTLAKP